MNTRITHRTIPGGRIPFSVVTAGLIGCPIVLLPAIVLLPIGCAVAVYGEDPVTQIPSIALSVLYISAFIGGISAAYLGGKSPLAGSVTGCILCCFLSVLSIIFSIESVFPTFLFHLGTIPAASIGGLLLKKRPRHPYRNRRYHH